MSASVEVGFQQIGNLPTSTSLSVPSEGFRLNGLCLRPKDLRIIGELLPARNPPRPIGTLLSELGCGTPKDSEPREMGYLAIGMEVLAQWRSLWASREPVPVEEAELMKDQVFDCLRLFSIALKVSENHDVQVGHRVESFRLHGFVADVEDEYQGMVIEDWVWVFGRYPLWATDWAMKRFLENETRRPTPSAVKRYVPEYRLEKAAEEVVSLTNNLRFWRTPAEQLIAEREAA